MKLDKLRENAAGIDVGSEKIYIGLEDESVHDFGTFTSEFAAAIALLKQRSVETVAMESTGVWG